MTYYVGNEVSSSDVLGPNNLRFLYAIRRTEDGIIYFSKTDQLKDIDSVFIINDPGLAQNDYEGFTYGIDYFDGRLATDHSRPFSNLHWDQYRWDNRSMYYYINDNGEMIVVTGKTYTYDVSQIVTP
jgi:hypothetical protein